MRRIVWLLAGVLLVVPSLASDSPKEYDATVEVDELEGTWRASQTIIQTFRGNRYVYSVDGAAFSEGTYQVGKHCKPLSLDKRATAGLGNGRTVKSIFRMEGDTLRTAVRLEDDDRRPKSFEEDGLYITVWKLVRK
jgi:uncharacterized protein (TIGR03067 family)